MFKTKQNSGEPVAIGSLLTQSLYEQRQIRDIKQSNLQVCRHIKTCEIFLIYSNILVRFIILMLVESENTDMSIRKCLLGRT